MSLYKIVEVSCDSCYTTLDEACATGIEARRNAREDGWRVSLPGGRDLCPDCR